MKNVYKVLGIIALVVMVGCSNGSTDSSNGNGRLLEFSLIKNGDTGIVQLKYENLSYSGITLDGDFALDSAISDFTVIIDNQKKTITSVKSNMVVLDIYVEGGPYVLDTEYPVKAVYTANPSRKLMTTGYKGEDIVVSSFEEEGKLTARNYW